MPRDIFTATDQRNDLAGKSVRGGMATMAGQGALFALNMVRTVILARLLTPADFGIVGMVTVVVNFAQMFKDAGLSLATVQQEKISHEQISTLFWINLLISVALGLAVLVSAPLVAWFYGRPELTAVTAVLSLSFLLGGFTIQHHALLQRHMRFTALAALQIVTQTLSLGVAIALAAAGWRYWALVGGSLSCAAVGALLTFAACPWVPGRMRKGTGVRAMLKFGGHISGFNFINYFARNADNLLIGRYIGAAALGFYDRAYRILLFPITMMSGPLSSVAIPALCRLRHDRPRLHKYYLHILYLISLFAGPIVGIAFLCSEEIVLVLLGSEWEPVAPVYRLLAIGGLLQPLYNTQAWLHLAAGRSDRVLRWSFIGTPIILASFIMGLPWGINGIALAYSIAIVLVTVLSLAYAAASADMRRFRILVAVARPVGATVLAVLVVWPLRPFMPTQTAGLTLAIMSGMFILSYGILLTVLYRGMEPLRDVKKIMDQAVKFRGKMTACTEEDTVA